MNTPFLFLMPTSFNTNLHKVDDDNNDEGDDNNMDELELPKG